MQGLNPIDVLAVARLVRLVRRDTITEPVRAVVLARGYERSEEPWVADLLDCSWCVAVWTAGFVYVARRRAPRLWDPIARVLAMSFVGAVAEMTSARA